MGKHDVSGIVPTPDELGLTQAEIDELLDADSHQYNCRCEKCLRWWARMGSDPDAQSYGPFTDAEVHAERERLRVAGENL